MTDDTRSSGLVSIGELARSTGIAVRTIRFYCDEGILESQRSAGGHRMFDAGGATERLLLVRRMRALGLGLNAITEVLHGERSVAEAADAESARLDIEFRSMAWRRAALRAVGAATPAQRAARLALLADVENGETAYDCLVQFWRHILSPISGRDVSAWLCGNVPEPPADPTVDQVVAYAELTALATTPGMTTTVRQQLWRTQPHLVGDPQDLFDRMSDLMTDVAALVSGGIEPRSGSELDRFVDAHARAQGERDTPDFRQRLLTDATDSDPRIHRYWSLTEQLLGTRLIVGPVHNWLYEALARAEPTTAR
ncbi:MerR family transcriptional regulator [Nocardia sp. 2]|uniref:MerR family transcriptional regulator n=1 Tax=Nocardia acididurans TaxID=2802282 RepID=A0ABS1M4U8_9NOCA|nr:MerR family transcriptional regulator [Nocardia acididurans]MBL1075678.1 MerR family transcriptional regulator [Nocardia acididurans]